MADKTQLELLIGAWRTNLTSDQYDEGLSMDLLTEIRNASPERYAELLAESGYNHIVLGE